MRRRLLCIVAGASALGLLGTHAYAYRFMKTAFMRVYPSAANSILDDVPSRNDHCGLCHFDFGGGGTLTPYGSDFLTARNSGTYANDDEALAAIGVDDSDGDGFINDAEITDLVTYSNTPTFPGLTAANVGSVSAVNAADLAGRLTPTPASPVELSTWGRIKALYTFD